MGILELLVGQVRVTDEQFLVIVLVLVVVGQVRVTDEQFLVIVLVLVVVVVLLVRPIKHYLESIV